jgi:hypothetical protein
VLHVVLKKVPLEANVFGALSNQGVMSVSRCALVVRLASGCSIDGFVKDLPRNLAKAESLVGGIVA